MTHTLVEELMTPIEDVFMLDADAIINQKLTRLIADRLYSRIPVYEKERKNIIGIILVHDILEAAARRYSRQV